MSLYKLYIIVLSYTLLLTISGCATADKTTPSCCLIASPEITLSGEKTAIERQIIGEYKELEKDAWIISSVKTNIYRGERISTGKASDEKLLGAMKIREFHERKIRDYKSEGSIGESNKGLVAYRKIAKYEKNSYTRKILLTVIEEENKARKTIFYRTLLLAGIKKPKEKELNAFGKVFAEEQHALAGKNDWIQNTNGMWIKKK